MAVNHSHRTGSTPGLIAPDPIDIEDLCDSFAFEEWSLDGDRLRSVEASLQLDRWLDWDVPPTTTKAVMRPENTTANQQPGGAREKEITSDFQTPMRWTTARLPLRTPYPPGTSVRPAPSAMATHRRISDRKVAEQLFSCVAASASKMRPMSRPPQQIESKMTHSGLTAQRRSLGRASAPLRGAAITAEDTETHVTIDSITLQSRSLRSQLNVSRTVIFYVYRGLILSPYCLVSLSRLWSRPFDQEFHSGTQKAELTPKDRKFKQAVILIHECPVMNISYVSSGPLPSQVLRSHRLHRLTGVGKDP
jgi:hypothetical protein